MYSGWPLTEATTVSDMRDRTPRPMTLAVLLLVATITLAGCFSVESNFTINDDGTADVELVTLIDTAQLTEFAEMFGEDTSELDGLGGEDLLNELTEGDDPCGDLTGSLGDYETNVQEIDNGTELGVSCTVTGVPIEDLNTIGEDSSFTIEQDDTGTRFSAVLEGVDELTGDSEEITQLLDVSLDELFSIVFTVTAPGSLGDNNASSTDGATASWDITADAAFVTGGDATMNAEWTPGGDSDSGTLLIALLVAALVIGLIVVLVIVLRRRGSASDGSTGGEPVPMSPPPPPPGAAPPMAPPPAFAEPSAPPTTPPTEGPAAGTPPPPPPPT